MEFTWKINLEGVIFGTVEEDKVNKTSLFVYRKVSEKTSMDYFWLNVLKLQHWKKLMVKRL